MHLDVLRHLFLRLVKSNARLGATRGTVQRFLAAEILQRAFRAAHARAAARRLGTSVSLAIAQFRAAQESEIPNFKGSDLSYFPLVSADFWTSDHLSERSRSVDVFFVTRARGTLTLKRR